MRSFAHLLGGILIVVLLMGMLTSCADSSSANPGDRDDLLPPGQEQPGQPVPTDETAITPVPTQTAQAPIMGDIPAPEGMAAFLVASGAPSSGSADQVDLVLFVAGSQLVGEDPAGLLPEEARLALEAAQKTFPDDMLLVVYTGYRGSSGYSVAVTEIQSTADGLKVLYHVTSPSPRTMGLTVLTHPYTIVRLTGAEVSPENISFEEVK